MNVRSVLFCAIILCLSLSGFVLYAKNMVAIDFHNQYHVYSIKGGEWSVRSEMAAEGSTPSFALL